ncbi:MAG: multidrug ABC transporter permease [Rickettsiales bacterium]|nr:multidrug ABC transporter permease [Rickettsiales bacterium]
MTIKKVLKIKDFSNFNFLGFYTLYIKEIKRFLNVGAQTLIAPAVTTLLFYGIFSIALGRNAYQINSYSFSEFLAPGLICMAILQNSFANTSSSILISKVQGNIVDILMPPISESELTFAFALGGITRGLMVGLVVAFTIYFFVPFKIHSLFYVIFFSIASALFLSLLGIFCGVWSLKFDHMAGITNFIITPLTFLSGTFYSINRLPEFWQLFAKFNPFFYMIDGLRYGFLGINDANLNVGIMMLVLGNIFFIFLCKYMFRKGYRLKS